MLHVSQCADRATSGVGSIRRSMWLRTAACALFGCALTSHALALQVSKTVSGVGTLANRPARPAFYDLSDLDALYSDGSLGPVELDQSVGGAAAFDGSPLTIQGQVFDSGFGMRAPGVIAFDLKGQALRMTVWVGVDDTAPASGSARFQVHGDGQVLFDSGLRQSTDAALFSGAINLRGVRELLLVTLDGDDGFDGDYADWGAPTLISTARVPAGNGRALRRVRGQWGPVMPWPVQPISAALLPTGEILSHASALSQGAGNPDPGAAHDLTRVDIWNAATSSHTTVDHPTDELFGAGQARLADGSLVELGGFAGRSGGSPSGAPLGRTQSSRFATASGAAQWVPTASMESARWGSTALTLGDGSVLALGGSDANVPGALRPEVLFNGVWRTLTGVDLGGYLSVGDAPLDRTFPMAHVAPDGRVFWAGWDERMGLIDARSGAGSWDFETNREAVQRAWGTSTQLRPDSVLVVGGVDHMGSPGAGQRTAVRCFLGGTNPTASATGSMLLRRADHNATILCDGSVLVTGGNAQHADRASVASWQVPEVFDPASGEWTTAAAADRARGFRSSALLLPDGRVWTGGGRDALTAQIFTPAYLFRSDTSGDLAPRPFILSAPSAAAYSGPIAVGMISNAAISRVTLVRLGSSTHGTNSDQRFLELGFTQAGSLLTVTAPARGHEAPPGHYMLFVFDEFGVPSEAQIVRLGPPRPTSWQLATSTDGSAPAERHEAAGVTVGGKFYLIGGRGSRPTQEYDPVDRTWSTVGFPPFELHHFQPVVVDDLVYVVGAFTGDFPNELNVDQVYTWNPATNVWTAVGAVPVGRRRGSAGTVVYDGKIYLVGGNNQGHNGGARPWFDCYDPGTNTWTVLPDAPRARDHFLASVVGNRLVLAGGRTTELPNPFENTIPEVDVYDFTSGVWKTLAQDIPTERAGTMALPVGRHVVVIGGESASMVLSHGNVEALDVYSELWQTLPNLVIPRHSGGIGILDGCVLVASGSGNQGGMPELPNAELLAASDVLALDALNLVQNGGFNDGLTGWSTTSSTGGSATLAAAAGIEPPSLRLVASSVTRTVAAQPGQDYACRALYRLSGIGTATLSVEYVNLSGAVIGQSQVTLSQSIPWRTAELLFTAPSGTAFLRPVADVAGAAELLLDDVTIAER